MKKEQGFSLVELLIVVAIIGIIATIAVPSLLAARRASNESAAIGMLRTIGSAEAGYMSQTGKTGFFTDLKTASYLDSAWSSGVRRDGFAYNEGTIQPTLGRYHFTAVPVGLQNGTKSYALAEDHVIRYTFGVVVLGPGAGTPIPVN